MRVSWIDEERLKELLNELSDTTPKNAETAAAWEVHTLPETEPDSAAEPEEPAQSFWEPESAAPAPAQPNPLPPAAAGEEASPEAEVPQGLDEDEGLPLEEPQVPGPEIARIRDRLRQVRENAVAAGLLARATAPAAPEVEAPSPSVEPAPATTEPSPAPESTPSEAEAPASEPTLAAPEIESVDDTPSPPKVRPHWETPGSQGAPPSAWPFNAARPETESEESSPEPEPEPEPEVSQPLEAPREPVAEVPTEPVQLQPPGALQEEPTAAPLPPDVIPGAVEMGPSAPVGDPSGLEVELPEAPPVAPAKDLPDIAEVFGDTHAGTSSPASESAQSPMPSGAPEAVPPVAEREEPPPVVASESLSPPLPSPVEPQDDLYFEVPLGTIVERLEAFAGWAQRRIGDGKLMMVDDQGDLLWGPGAQAGIVLSTMLASSAASRGQPTAFEVPPVQHQPAGDEVLSVVSCPTRVGMLHLAVLQTAPVSESEAQLLRQALQSAVNVTG